MVRVVISRGEKVLSDNRGQLVSAQDRETAAAGGSGGGGSAGARDGSFLLLDLPSMGWGGGESNREAGMTAAALTVALLQQTSLGAVEGADGNHLPVAYVTVLLLPHEVANEMDAWVMQQQLSVHDLTPLVQDLAFVLDVRDALQLGLASAAGMTNDSISGHLPRLSASALAAAESLLEFFRRARLHSAEDFVLVLRQQLLVAMRRVQPLAAGTIPTREESSSAAGSAAGGTAAATSAAAVAVPAAAQDVVALAAVDNVDSVDQRAKDKTGAARPAGLETDIELEAAVAGDMTRKSAGVSTSSSGRKSVPKGSSSSSSSSRKNAAMGPVLRRPEYFSAADTAAAAAGGWRGFMLCWRGFQGQGVESQYLLFKAERSCLFDWAAKTLLAASVVALMLKYLQPVPGRAWPPHKIFGEYCSPRKVWTCSGVSVIWSAQGLDNILKLASDVLNFAASQHGPNRSYVSQVP